MIGTSRRLLLKLPLRRASRRTERTGCDFSPTAKTESEGGFWLRHTAKRHDVSKYHESPICQMSDKEAFSV